MSPVRVSLQFDNEYNRFAFFRVKTNIPKNCKKGKINMTLKDKDLMKNNHI